MKFVSVCYPNNLYADNLGILLDTNETIIVKNGDAVTTNSGVAITGSIYDGNHIIVEAGGAVSTRAGSAAAIKIYGDQTDSEKIGLAGTGSLKDGASNIVEIAKGATVSNETNRGAITVTSNNLLRVSGTIRTKKADTIVLYGDNNHVIVSGDLSTQLENSDGVWGGGQSNNLIDFSGAINTTGDIADGIDFSEGNKNALFVSGSISTTGKESDCLELGSHSILTFTGALNSIGELSNGIYAYLNGNVSHISGKISATGLNAHAIHSGRSDNLGESNLFHLLNGASLTGAIHNADSDDNTTSYLTFGYAKDNSGQALLTQDDPNFSLTLENSITSDSTGNWDGYFVAGTTELNGAVNKFNDIYIGGDSFQDKTLFAGDYTQTDIKQIPDAVATLNIKQSVSASGNVVVGSGSHLGIRVNDSEHAKMDVAGDFTMESGAKINSLKYMLNSLNSMRNSQMNVPLVTYGGSLKLNGVDRTAEDFDMSDFTEYTALVDQRLYHESTDKTLYMDILLHSFASKSMIPATLGVSRMLDIINASANTEHFDTLLAQLRSIKSDEMLQRSYTQLAPIHMTTIPRAVFSSAGTVDDIISSHVRRTCTTANADSVPLDSGNAIVRKKREFAPFVEMVMSRSDQDDKNGVPGYSLKTGGIVIGTDYLVNDTLLWGISGAYVNPSLDSNDNMASSDLNTFQGNLFTSYFTQQFQIDAYAGFGHSEINSQRSIGVMGSQAVSEHDARYFSFGVGAGYKKSWDNRLAIEPFLELNYVHLKEDGYQETGAGSVNLQIAESRNESFRSGLGVKLSKPFIFATGMTVCPQLSYQWQHEFKDDAMITSASFVEGGSTFLTTGISPDANHHILGVGIKALLTSDISLYLDYTYDTASSYDSHNGRLGVNWIF